MSSFYSSLLLVYFVHFQSVMAVSDHAVFRNDGEVLAECLQLVCICLVLWVLVTLLPHHTLLTARESSLLIKSMFNSLFYGAPVGYKPRISNSSQYLAHKVHFLLWVF